jgi:hypothetical protein
MPRKSIQSQPIPEETPAMPQTSKGSARMSPLGVALILIILVTAAILGAKQLWFSGEPQAMGQPQDISSTDGSATPESVRELISQVSRHIVVKQGEDPTVATIQDVEVLKRQNPVFYADAQNGDRLLIWSDKAVLYSQSRDIILSVLPISLPASALNQGQSGGSTSTASSQSVTKEETATVEVRNGTATVGVARAMSEKLAALGLKTLAPTDAKSKDYSQTIILKMSDKDLPQSLQAIQSVAVNAGVVEELKEGEPRSTADFLIIVGADYR